MLFCLGSYGPLSLRTGLILPHMLGLDTVSFPHSMSLLFFCLISFSTLKIKIKKGGEYAEFYFILFFLLIAFQTSHVFFHDISVHYALIKYAYICLRVYV